MFKNILLMSSNKTVNNNFKKIKVIPNENDDILKKSKNLQISKDKFNEDIEYLKSINDDLKKENKIKDKIGYNNYMCKKIGKCNYKCKFLKILKTIIINILIIFYNFLSFFFYYLSLEGCFYTQSQCIPLLSTMFLGKLLFFGILSALMISIEIYLIVIKSIYVYHLIYIIIFYIIIYQYDHGTKLNYHGLYNIILTIFLIIIFTIIIGIINLIIYIKKSKKKIYRNILIVFFSFILIKIVILFISFGNSCKNWDKGLNSTKLNNSPEYNCSIIYPKRCYLYNFDDFFDLSYYLRKECSIKEKQVKEHKNFIKYLKIDKKIISLSKLTHFGFPITVNNPLLRKYTSEYFNIHNFVYKNTILMDLYDSNKTKYYINTLQPEVEIIYDKKTKNRRAKINLIKNETLSIIRSEITNNPNNTNISLFNNIMIIYIDCVSRQHFLRKMKKTSTFIEKFMKFNNDLGLSAYQYMKYQTFAHWTQPNVYPMFYSSRNEFGRKINIVKYLKENGYITGHSGNLCSKESFDVENNEFINNGIIIEEYDHENIAMFCDPNYSSEDTPYPLFSGPYGILRKCLYGLDTFKYLIEFGKQFWNIYKDNKKYLRLSFQDGHEPSGQVVKYLDESLYNYLNELYENNTLNDTFLFILSDHGNSYFNYIYYYILRSDDSLIERGYGTLFIIVPSNKMKKIDKNYYNNLEKNQQTLISPFDIHDTIIHIIFGNNTLNNHYLYSHYGNSLLSEFDGKNRNCRKWQGYFKKKEECLCKNNTLI